MAPRARFLPVQRWTSAVPIGWVAVLALVVAALFVRALLRPPIDLDVYLLGGSTVLDGGDNLYKASELTRQGLPFTYTPFAALMFVPFTLVGLTAASALVVLASTVCLIRVCYLTLTSARWTAAFETSLSTVVVVATVATIIAEPATTNLSLGQLNIILCWAVVEDIIGPRNRFTGALIGVASGIKLVPGIFIGYYLLTRRWREAMVSAGIAAATIGIGAVVMPQSSREFWTGLGRLENRVAAPTVNSDGLSQVGNQSALGMLHRLAGQNVKAMWVIACIVIVLAACRCVWLRRGHDHDLESVVVLSLAGLLISPVSWTHHWVWITPLVIALVGRAREAGGRLVALPWALIAAWTFTAAIRLVWLGEGSGPDPAVARYYRILAANSYVVLGLLSLVYLVWSAVRDRKAAGRENTDRADRHPDRYEIRDGYEN